MPEEQSIAAAAAAMMKMTICHCYCIISNACQRICQENLSRRWWKLRIGVEKERRADV